MDFRYSIGALSLYAGWTWSQKVEGVNSTLKDGRHILMWDFDNVPLEDIRRDLAEVQLVFTLPPIFVIESSKEHYHAYCWKRTDFAQAAKILLSTACADREYVTIGIVRGFWTLRISPKASGESFRPVLAIARSGVKADCGPSDVASTTEYWTRRL